MPPKPEKSIMDEIVENINAESRKIHYNPEIDTNWCHLPIELREKCIEEMDFVTRTRIRAASRIEKSYVDANIYHFDKLIFQSTSFITLKLCESKKGGEERIILSLYPEDYPRKIPPFKFCDFQEIQCYAKGGNLPDVLDKWVTECAPFRFKTLRCKGGNFEIFEYFLKNSWDGVEEIFLDIERRQDFSIESVLCPSFIKAKTVFIEGVPVNKLRNIAHHIAKKWSEIDANIGTMCHLHSGKIYQPVIVFDQNNRVVRMVNESKLVFLQSYIQNYRGGAGELILEVVRNPDTRSTDVPNEN